MAHKRPGTTAKVERKIRLELRKAAKEVKPNPNALAKIQGKIQEKRKGNGR